MSNPAPKSDTSHPSIVPVDFQKRPRLVKYTTKGGDTIAGLYHFPGKEGFYVRPYCKGKQREKKLNATSLKYAQIEYGKLLSAIAKYETGETSRDPFVTTEEKTLSDLCDFYKDKGYPRHHGPPSNAKQLADEKTRVEHLKKWGAKKVAKELSRQDCDDYYQWRTKRITQGKGGGRTVDLELVTLSNIFHCAMLHDRTTGITANPFSVRKRFRNAKDVVHCREAMPRNADELHALARFMFSSKHREVYGFVLLFQAMIGHRIHEILELRMDAKSEKDPGYFDGKILHLFRSKTSKGTYGHIDVDSKGKKFPELKTLLEAHRRWHQQRYPAGNPWFFPSARRQGQQLETGGLTHALARAIQAMHGKDTNIKRTSHGMRAYRVNVLRSQGLLDAEIAVRIGQKSGGPLIVSTYGEGLSYALDYTPSKENVPAWDKWLPEELKTGIREEQSELDI